MPLDGNPEDYVTQWPLTSEGINVGIDEALVIETASQEPEGLWEKHVLEPIAEKTITPGLRTNFDRRFARDIVNSFMTFTAGAVACTLSDSILVDLASAGVMGYGSQNINYVLHQHAHVELTNNKTLNKALDYYLSLTVGMTVWHWRIQHVLGHHGHGRNPEFGELKTSDYNTDRRPVGGFLKLLLKHDIPRSGAVLVEPVKHMASELWKGESGASEGVPEKKIEQIKHMLRQAGADDEVLNNLVFDTTVEVEYVKSLIGILGVWGAIGLLVSQNLFLLPYYLVIQVLTKCTDVINHSRPDGSGRSEGMINLSKKLAHNIPGFTWHRLHHMFGFLHPQHYGAMSKYLWEQGQIPIEDFEKCDVQPGADTRVLTKETAKGVNRTISEFFQRHPKISSVAQGFSSLA